MKDMTLRSPSVTHSIYIMAPNILVAHLVDLKSNETDEIEAIGLEEIKHTVFVLGIFRIF